jgi:hypothetical protein
MSNTRVYNDCPWCLEKVESNQQCILITRAVAANTGNYRNPNPPRVDKVRVNFVGGNIHPKNLMHLKCWNEMLQSIDKEQFRLDMETLAPKGTRTQEKIHAT